jgi:predicted esterase
MEELFVYPKIKARYSQIGEINENTRDVWIVCHGYGYLARYFIRKFVFLHNDKTVIIAPEGLSRFYLEGFSGKVGATWMTRENRLVEIENYTAYLNEIYKLIPNPNKIRINVLGFSQGTSTVSRWVLHQDIKVDRLILWAGDFPPDIQQEKARQRVKELKNLIMIYGDSDQFVNPERLQSISDRIHELDASPDIIHYSGGHDIEQEALEKMIEFIYD